MSNSLFIGGVLLLCATVLAGCATPTVEPTYCNPSNETIAMIMDDYGIDLSGKNFTRCDVDSGRGGQYTLTFDGTTIHRKYGWCSSGGSDCNIAYCVRSPVRSDFATQKANICSTLTNATYIMRSSVSEETNITERGSEVLYDTSTEVQVSCLAGAFETQFGSEWVWSVKQDSSSCTGLEDGQTCGAFVVPGPQC